MSAKQIVEKIVELDEKIAELREELDGFGQKAQEDALLGMFRSTYDEIGETDMLPMSLIRVADLMCYLEGDEAVKTFAKGLEHPNPDMQMMCGDALLHLSEEGLARILPAVEAALVAGGSIACEMPYLLTEVDDPDVPSVLERFLAVDDTTVVSSALEAIAEFGDPASVPALQRFVDDKRIIESDEDDEQEWTIGQLASGAIEMISGDEEE